MTDTPPKPKLRRWRWLVAGLLVVAVSGVAFNSGSRFDPRLVGTWVRTDLTLLQSPWTFTPSGVRSYSPSPEVAASGRANAGGWHVVGDFLYLTSGEGVLERLQGEYRRRWSKALGRAPSLPHFRILEASAGVLRLQRMDAHPDGEPLVISFRRWNNRDAELLASQKVGTYAPRRYSWQQYDSRTGERALKPQAEGHGNH